MPKVDNFSNALIKTPSGPKIVPIQQLITGDVDFICQETGMTKSDLARSIGVHRRTIYRWGEGCIPKTGVFLTIRDYAAMLRNARA